MRDYQINEVSSPSLHGEFPRMTPVIDMSTSPNLDVHDVQVDAVLGLTLFVIGYAFGPMIWVSSKFE